MTNLSTSQQSVFNDPLGQAILDYSDSGISAEIIVVSDISEDDIIPSHYLFRSYDEMPFIERVALDNAIGKTLDVGAGAGVHASYLSNKGLDVHCIDTSQLAIKYINATGGNGRMLNFFELPQNEKYDTLLFLMNGIGIAGKLSNLKQTLIKATSHLNPNGKLIFDSSDVKYLYEDEEDGYWVDLNASYYGDFKFQMHYKNHKTDWFEWLYVDFENLKLVCDEIDLKVVKLAEENEHFLVEITKR